MTSVPSTRVAAFFIFCFVWGKVRGKGFCWGCGDGEV